MTDKCVCVKREERDSGETRGWSVKMSLPMHLCACVYQSQCVRGVGACVRGVGACIRGVGALVRGVGASAIIIDLDFLFGDETIHAQT